jgi:flagellar hook-basal body complex protein FliE
MIEAITALSALPEMTPMTPIGRTDPAAGTFMVELEKGAQGLNQSLNVAESGTRALAAGQNVAVHDVMISLEQARLDMQFAVQVRNRVMAAYHDIISMQV